MLIRSSVCWGRIEFVIELEVTQTRRRISWIIFDNLCLCFSRDVVNATDRTLKGMSTYEMDVSLSIYLFDDLRSRSTKCFLQRWAKIDTLKDDFGFLFCLSTLLAFQQLTDIVMSSSDLNWTGHCLSNWFHVETLIEERFGRSKPFFFKSMKSIRIESLWFSVIDNPLNSSMMRKNSSIGWRGWKPDRIKIVVRFNSIEFEPR